MLTNGGYFPRPLYVKYGAGIPTMPQPEAATCVSIAQVCGKKSKAQEAAMSTEIDTMLSKKTIELGLGNKGLFTYSFIIPKKKWDKSLHNESEASQPVYYLYKIQNDSHKKNQGGHYPDYQAVLLEINSAH